MMDKAHRETLAQHVLALSTAQETEVIVSCDNLALSRFTHESIHQNLASAVITVRIRVINTQQTGVASTNATDEASLRDLVQRAIEIARLAPRDPQWTGLPHEGTIAAAPANAFIPATAHATAEARATIADAVFGISERFELWAAGYISTSTTGITIANSHGRLASFDGTESQLNIKQSGPDSTGYAEVSTVDFSTIDGSATALCAAQKARDTSNPQAVAPGSWTVVLEPAALAEFLSYLTEHFSAQAIDEGSSCFQWSDLGSKLVDPGFSFHDDWQHSLAPSMPFDYEGSPRQRLALIDQGIIQNAATDSRWAARLKRPNSGHALPAPNSTGPQALCPVVLPGTVSLDSLVAGVERGLYISRFWYIRTVDRRRTILTGMTRDGTYLIEDGRLTHGVHNLRFNQSILEALQRITLSNTLHRSSGYNYTMVVPAAKIEGFTFSSSTSF